jgi:hypothetical protein
MRTDILPMGKFIRCHHGAFTLPSEIYAVEICDNNIQFQCEDGVYEASQENKWQITKIEDQAK